MQIAVPWVHILSFSVWLGANLFVLGIVWPALRSLPAAEFSKLLRPLAGSLNAVVAVAAPVTVLSGLGGVFPGGGIADTGGGAGAFIIVLAKTVLTGVMVLNHGLQAFRYAPSLDAPVDGRNPWWRLLAANVFLGVVILLLGLAGRRLAL